MFGESRNVLCPITFIRKLCRLRDIVKNVIAPDRSYVTIRRMRIACWTIKATFSYSEYVIFIAFARQQYLRERFSVLRSTYIACLVNFQNDELMCKYRELYCSI